MFLNIFYMEHRVISFSCWSQDQKILCGTGSDIHCRYLPDFVRILVLTGNLITRSDTAISTNFVQSKTIQESLKHFFIIFMQQDNVFTKTENCHSAHICPQCRALSLVHQANSTILFLVLELVFRFAISSHLSRWNIFYTTLPYV